ncbi:hypothetical protein HNP86_000528 [Methanococcus maripaludis]|uniref:Uncharacterized protein n=1 Tax=Methanococcus maripaludis TaxID=39152 RepID=A0A7J9RY41_METMI|nr:hypothetical protein [Methanococcus maripaludis]MBA2850397.1 hypothetical protein [Methanococcus maripaludis]MBA2857830.1 hypothetical protein [Methanococcus maripaludis]MBB6066949.1 hypothetical protein [Methanococcus maripaludis]MBM7409238.1 hypothetical protein [Methanococcus maripaludis]
MLRYDLKAEYKIISLLVLSTVFCTILCILG